MLHRKIVVDKGRCEIVCFSQIRAFPALFGIKSAHPHPHSPSLSSPGATIVAPSL